MSATMVSLSLLLVAFSSSDDENEGPVGNVSTQVSDRSVDLHLRRETETEGSGRTEEGTQRAPFDSNTNPTHEVPISGSDYIPRQDSSTSYYCMEGEQVASACQSIVNTILNSRDGIHCAMNEVLSRSGFAPAPACSDEPVEVPAESPPIQTITDTTEEEVITVYEQIPAVIEEEFASLPIDPGEVSFEPDLLGFGYINRHTNIYTTAETQEISTELLETTVEVRVIPIEHHFDYGDGTTRTTADPGGPHTGDVLITDTPTATSHVYQDTGRHPVEISTTFIGEYRIPEAPAPLNSWTPISNTTTIPATPGEADIWRINHRHVAEECQTTTDWGCGGPVELKPGDQPPEIFAEHYDQNGNYIGD